MKVGIIIGLSASNGTPSASLNWKPATAAFGKVFWRRVGGSEQASLEGRYVMRNA
jgi:hypothetical protein